MLFRILSILVVCVFSLTACGRQVPKSEEYLQSVFDRLNIALSYEKICENGKHMKAIDVNLYGNMQTIAAIYGGELIKNNPNASKDEIFKMVNDRRDLINVRMEKVLAEHGCKSEIGADGEKLLNALLKIRPGDTFAFISKDLEKVGGKINMDSPKTPPVPDKVEGIPNPQETR